ncbi:MAG: hypothetical protein ACYDHN_01850 [Solirubrobacteraceae bacterium]
MSSPILPISGPLDPAHPSVLGTPGDDDLAALVSELGAGDGSLAIDVARGAPPPEVLEQMIEAHAIGQRLRERGVELRFSLPEDGTAPRVDLHDSEQPTVRRLTIAEAIQIACE